MNNIDVVIVGNIAYDINTFPRRDKDTDKVVINRGGEGYYSLIPASLYTKTGIVARVGNDFNTKFHHTYLTDDGQTKTFKPEIYEETLISIEDFPKEYYEAKYIHIATNFPSKQKEFIDVIRKHSKAIISIDTHEAYMEKKVPFIK